MGSSFFCACARKAIPPSAHTLFSSSGLRCPVMMKIQCLFAAVSLLSPAFVTLAASENADVKAQDVSKSLLTVDDTCLAQDGEQGCALNALQVKELSKRTSIKTHDHSGSEAQAKRAPCWSMQANQYCQWSSTHGITACNPTPQACSAAYNLPVACYTYPSCNYVTIQAGSDMSGCYDTQAQCMR